MFDVAHIAKLARLGLTQEEQEKFAKELTEILAFVEKLNEVDTQNIQPTAQVTGKQNVTRPDESQKSVDSTRQQILKNAPETKNNRIKVKAVFE